MVSNPLEIYKTQRVSFFLSYGLVMEYYKRTSRTFRCQQHASFAKSQAIMHFTSVKDNEMYMFKVLIVNIHTSTREPMNSYVITGAKCDLKNAMA